MALALSCIISSALNLQSSSSSQSEMLSTVNPWPSSLVPPCRFLASSMLPFSRRRNQTSAFTSCSCSKKNKKSFAPKENDTEEDAFEALFNMLEEDLKNDELPVGDDDDISEEDIDELQRELEAALGIGNNDNDDENEDGDVEMLESAEDTENADHEDEDEEEERPVKLKNWQLRKLASSLKKGRRKISIKSLAAELCLDRATVLEFLRDPPPNLMMMSAALPDEPEPTLRMSETKTKIESAPAAAKAEDAAKSDSKIKAPIHVLQSGWFAQKRLKKVQVETLDRVYKRTKRPTNTMISSIVHVTNIPRKRVVKWFEDKRTEDRVPKQHTPYRRSATGTASSC